MKVLRAVQQAGIKRHLPDQRHAEAVVNHLHDRMEGGSQHLRLGAQLAFCYGGTRVLA